MASGQASGSDAGAGGVTGYFKNLLGLGASGAGTSAGMGIAQPSAAAAAGAAPRSQSEPPLKIPPRIKPHPERQDSLPEIVMTPSDVGIYEVSHAGAKLTWRKYFTPQSAWDNAPSPTQPAPPQPPAGQ